MFTMDDWLGLTILMFGIALLLALIVNVVIQMWCASRALLVIWRASRKARAMPMPVAKCVICGALHFDDGKSCDCKPIFASDPRTREEQVATIQAMVDGRLGMRIPLLPTHTADTRPMTNDEIKAMLPTVGDMAIGYYVGGRLGSPPCDEHEFPPGPHRTKTCLKCGAMMWMKECKRDFTPGDQQ